ncbi:MAG: methyl-accepting chemotaxis protein, partial [Nitrospiria bacterium]
MKQSNRISRAFNQLSIKAKLFRLSGVLLLAIFLIGGYGGLMVSRLYNAMQEMQGNIQSMQEQSLTVKEVLEEQQKIATRLEIAEDARRSFGDYKYWLTDLAVSWLNEAEENADASREKLEGLLKQMADFVPQHDLEQLKEHVEKIHALALEAVDSYIDENRVRGNALLAEARREVGAADQIFLSIVKRKQQETMEAEASATETSEKTIGHAEEVIVSAETSTGKAEEGIRFGIGFLLIVVMVSFLMTRFTITSLEVAQEAKLRKTKAIEKLVEKFENASSHSIQTVSSSAVTLHQAAMQMTGVIGNVATRSSNATAASEETSLNVQSVASASEELSISVREISSQVQKTSQVVNETVAQVERADQTSASLSEATGKIGKVVSMIKHITENINLLALNATIEAARAGESGKG